MIAVKMGSLFFSEFLGTDIKRKHIVVKPIYSLLQSESKEKNQYWQILTNIISWNVSRKILHLNIKPPAGHTDCKLGGEILQLREGIWNKEIYIFNFVELFYDTYSINVLVA